MSALSKISSCLIKCKTRNYRQIAPSFFLQNVLEHKRIKHENLISCSKRAISSCGNDDMKSEVKTKWKCHVLFGVLSATLGVSLCMFHRRRQNDDNSNSSKVNFPRLSTLPQLPVETAQCAEEKHKPLLAGSEVPNLPTYSASDVASHDSVEKRIWVCYKSGVYDITDFIPMHPGGDKILMAAGGALEPFWELFAIHKSSEALEILEKYRIGNLSSQDRGLAIENSDDPFASDPRRHPILKPHSVKPFNAEPPPELLVENFITPNDVFFIRNHLPVPQVEAKEYQLEICGLGIDSIYLTLDDLKTKFEKHTITSTLQCAGNRRSQMNEAQEVKGLNWKTAAIGTAEWTGVKLVDVLKLANVNFNDERIQHIQFEGLDMDPGNFPYGASIPADKGLDPKSDVLLAFEMNGQELSRDHGYPVRIIVPGVVGARNVKWLGKIIVSHEESNSHWQQNDYKGFSPNITWSNVDYKTSPAIQELPVNSAICQPSDNSKIHLDENTISAAGYAWSGGGRKIVRVDISADGGKTWHTANLEQDKSPLYRCWAWTLWQVSIPMPEAQRKKGSTLEITCKAVDSSYNVQPDTFLPIWNLRGVLSNAWHRIKVTIE